MSDKHPPDPTGTDATSSAALSDWDPETVRALAGQAKAVLRKRARGLRASMSKPALAARSLKIVERLKELPWLGEAGSVALFHAIAGRNEVDLATLDPELRARGVKVYYPSLEVSDRPVQERAMQFRDPGSPERMLVTPQGIAEPDPSLPAAAAIDVIVVPALLIDDRGYRLGYGGGFYDRTLPRFCPPARAIGVVFDFQLAADLPLTEHDVPVDLVVSDTRTLTPSNR